LVGEELELWNFSKDKDSSHTISTLLGITDQNSAPNNFRLRKDGANQKTTNSPQERKKKEEGEYIGNYEVHSLTGEKEQELTFIRTHLEKSSSLLILTLSKKQSEYLESVMKSKGFTTSIYKDESYFCSMEMISFWLTMQKWSRKEMIFLLKLITWVQKTKTGLLDELKYY
jgi:hypothetical protein